MWGDRVLLVAGYFIYVLFSPLLVLSGKRRVESTVEHCSALLYLHTNCLSVISTVIRPIYSEQ